MLLLLLSKEGSLLGCVLSGLGGCGGLLGLGGCGGCGSVVVGARTLGVGVCHVEGFEFLRKREETRVGVGDVVLTAATGMAVGAVVS